jgi:hypothetical protein
MATTQHLIPQSVMADVERGARSIAKWTAAPDMVAGG